MLGRFFPSFRFFFGMHSMYCGFILRDNWPLSSDGVMRCWCLFNIGGLRVLKLFQWHLLICISDCLFSLLGRLFSSLRVFNSMHVMHSGFILRDNWPLSGDGFMCCGCLFSFRCFYLFELS